VPRGSGRREAAKSPLGRDSELGPEGRSCPARIPRTGRTTEAFRRAEMRARLVRSDRPTADRLGDRHELGAVAELLERQVVLQTLVVVEPELRGLTQGSQRVRKYTVRSLSRFPLSVELLPGGPHVTRRERPAELRPAQNA